MMDAVRDTNKFTPARSGYNESKVKKLMLAGPVATSMKTTLEAAGYGCSCYEYAFDSEAEISALITSDHLPEAIICDISYNSKSIYPFIQSVNSNPAFKKVPVILVKENSSSEKIDGLRFYDDVISKDISADNLIEKITILKKFRTLRNTLPYASAVHNKKFPFSRYVLRFINIVLSITLLVLLSPLFALIALLIKLETHGPVFYISPRAGRGYKVFKFYKFRTMVEDADKRINDLKNLNQYFPLDNNSIMFFKIKSDPRVTRIGKFLRNTSLDELPQLFNVLKGDMSIVGNRPLPLYEANTLTVDQAARRFLAPAGITGLWQVEKRGRAEMSVQDRINLDIDYANNHSFLYDMRILLTTPKGIIQRTDV